MCTRQQPTNLRRLKDVAVAAVPPRLAMPARYWYRRALGRLDAELRVATALLRPGSTAINVGANFGIYTYAFVRAGARVEAFEPLPQCRRILAAYASPRVRVHNVALSDASGRLPLHIPVYDGRPEPGHATFRHIVATHQTVDVPVRTLDEFQFRDVSLIKVDVEGHELDVLRGARATLARERPVLVLEIYQEFLAYPIDRTFATLAEFGYQAYFIDRGQIRSVSPTGVPPDTETVHNFLFVHELDDCTRANLSARSRGPWG